MSAQISVESLFSFTRFNPECLIFLSLLRLNRVYRQRGFCKNTTIWQNILPVPTHGSHTNQESLVRESEGKKTKRCWNPCKERNKNSVFMKCGIREFWCWQSETFSSTSACKHRVVKNATAAKGAASWRRNRKIMLHFLNPGGLRRDGGGGQGGGKTSPAILPWFTVTASDTAPHYLYHVGGGGSKAQEKKAEDRYYIPLRAWSVQYDGSLSCLPLVVSWTKHRPADSLRTLLL